MSFLKPVTIKKFTTKNSLHFSKEIFDHQPDFSMGILDLNSLFTNIPLKRSIEICWNKLSKKSITVRDWSQSEFKEILSPLTEDFHFIFDRALYKQSDGAVIGFFLSPTIANVCLICQEKQLSKKWFASINSISLPDI